MASAVRAPASSISVAAAMANATLRMNPSMMTWKRTSDEQQTGEMHEPA
jgi:hypothetical protein